MGDVTKLRIPFSPDRFKRYAKELERQRLQSRHSDAMRDYNQRKPAMTDPIPAPVLIEQPVPQPEPQAAPIEQPKPPISPPKVDIIRPNKTGAGFLADLIRNEQARIRAQLAKAGEELKDAMSELGDVANEATNHVKAVKQETADLRASLGLNSNNPEP